MNKRQLEVEKAKIREEKKLLKELKKIYEDAAKEVEQKIRISNGKIDLLLSVFDELDDKQKSLLQSQIYQKKFQENLKKQLDELIGNLNADSYDSITRYLTDSYYTGYIGTMYDIQGQGIPLITPINEKQVTRAMTLNTKLSVPLYTRMGIDVGVLKKQIAKHISRGIATSSSYAHIARNIDGASNTGFNKAMRIARTEGHRIQVLSANDAQHAAKAKGCEVVKQWDATLDGRTRPMHRLLDGKLAEIDEPFVVDDMEVMYPGGFGIASQDVNCRCALLQRARWALDADELKTLKERAEYYGLDKTNDFDEFRQKYYKIEDFMKEQSEFCDKYGLSTDERYAINAYVSSLAYTINDCLRNDLKMQKNEKKIVSDLRSALNKIPDYTKEVTRSIIFYTNKELEDFIKDYKENKTITIKSFVSTTRVGIYNPEAQVQIFFKNVKHAKDISLFNFKEKEVLYSTDVEFDILNVKEIDGKYYIILSEKER